MILFALFYLWTRHLERYTTYPPILKASMFSRHRGRITSTCAGAFCACLAMYMFMYNTSIYYQGHRGLSAWENAIRVLPVNVAGTPAAVSHHIGVRPGLVFRHDYPATIRYADVQIAVVCLVSRYRTPYLIAAGGLASG